MQENLRNGLSGLLLLLMTNPLHAADSYWYHCQDGSRVRQIGVSYSKARKTVPCEVHYNTEWRDQLLWQAQVQQGYCEAKAESLVQKQRDQGWLCQRYEGTPTPRYSRP